MKSSTRDEAEGKLDQVKGKIKEIAGKVILNLTWKPKAKRKTKPAKFKKKSVRSRRSAASKQRLP